MQVERQAFYEPTEIERAVREHVARVREVDFLSFVPNGEPTLDINLGREIALLRPLGVKIAVITNGSLIWREDVRADLRQADWVSLKVDAVQKPAWRRINRPHRALRLASILDGMRRFAREYRGELATDTMLVAGVNDDEGHLEEIAGFLACLRPAVACLAVPISPPAERWVRSPDEAAINRAYQVFSSGLERVEMLTGYEGNAYAFTGDVEANLLSITAVQPMRQDAVNAFLARAGADWAIVRRLIAQGELVETEYEGRKFYARRLFR
jgi:wyosine [tRNA(Phe)-imidazoG37] synthetase (radical SAM superfamily)